MSIFVKTCSKKNDITVSRHCLLELHFLVFLFGVLCHTHRYFGASLFKSFYVDIKIIFCIILLLVLRETQERFRTSAYFI